MQRAMKLCGAAAAVAAVLLCTVAPRPAHGAPPSRSPAAVSEAGAEATVEELPQRPMTLRNGYHPGLFPFNKGEPFVVDPSTSAIDFNTRPPPPSTSEAHQRSDDYYDYDASKLEEVPYDYKGDPIDRKDVVEPGAPRPNDIKPGVKNKQTDIYQFLNLPVKYSSSDKFPLMSSSYANTKVQGSGSSASSLSNHKMPATPAPPTTSWYNAAKTTVRPTSAPTTPSTTSTTTTTTTTPSPPPSQEYEEESVYDYDYYHPQEPALVSDTAPTVTASSTTAASTTAAAATTTTTERQYPPSTTAVSLRPTVVVASSFPSTAHAPSSTDSSATTTTSSDNYDEDEDAAGPPPATVPNKTTSTTARPEIDSKPDGPSFADYDAIKPTEGGGEHRPHQQQQQQQQHFKPMPGSYPFGNDKTYPLITSGKVPMTFTAHVSSGISLNQKEPAQQYQQQHHQQQQQQQHQHHHTSEPAVRPPTTEPPHSYTAVNRPSPPEVHDSDRPADVSVHDGPTRTVASSSASRPPPPPPQSDIRHPSSTYSKNKPPVRPVEGDHFETVYFKVRPDAPAFPGAAAGNRPAANQPVHGRPYPPEPPAQKPSDRPKPPAAEAPRPQQPYPPDVYAAVKKPAPSQPDTSKFKPPKHVINHFIKTQPNEDNKSYALQTSFSIGMDAGDRTAGDARPAQGVGQVLMVEDGSPAEPVHNQTVLGPVAVAVKPVLNNNNNRATTSIPFVPPPPPPQQQQQQQLRPAPQYPRPQWENVPKPPAYYPPPKRDGPPPPPPPPQRTNLPNILPQFRPNAKVDAPPMMMAPAGGQSHSATIERVQIPMDHLRPPPLPKPQFLKVDRNDEDVIALDAAETLSADAPETRILHRTGPASPQQQQQPARVTTLQMIQHGASSSPTSSNNNNNNNNINNNKPVRQDDKGAGGDPVHVVYAANAPPRPSAADRLHHADDSVLLDPKDRSDVPVLKTKTAVNRAPVKSDFPYQIVKPEDGATAALEYKAYSPTKPDAARPNEHELVPNLQDYVPVETRGGGGGDPAANVVLPQKPITATLRTTEDNNNNNNNNHKTADEGAHKPQLHNFQIPFQPSMKLPENSNGWSVVRKAQVDNTASERVDETGGDAVASTEKFDPDNFKPQLVGGFMPINPLTEEAKEKKTAEQPERA